MFKGAEQLQLPLKSLGVAAAHVIRPPFFVLCLNMVLGTQGLKTLAFAYLCYSGDLLLLVWILHTQMQGRIFGTGT